MDQRNTSPPTSSLDPTALDNPVKQAIDVGEPHSRSGYSPLSCAQCSKVCTCLWAQMLIKLKDQSANELPLNTDVHEDKVPLFVCVCEGEMDAHAYLSAYICDSMHWGI